MVPLLQYSGTKPRTPLHRGICCHRAYVPGLFSFNASGYIYTKNYFIFGALVKKFIAAILTLIYLGSTTGATVHMHYCMGKVESWTLVAHDEKNCDNCGMKLATEKDKSCCKDEKRFYKNQTDQQAAQGIILLQQFSAASTIPQGFELPAALHASFRNGIPHSNAPPERTALPVYLRNCVFLL